MKLLIENWREYLDDDTDIPTGLSYSQMVEALSHRMKNAKLALTDGPIEIQTSKQKVQLKPDGLWYACGIGWLEFVRDDFVEGKGTHLYSIGYRKGAVLKVTPKDLKKFDLKYASYKAKYMLIDWDKLVEDGYAGVEFCPYEKGTNFIWYDSLDVPSGCVWDTNTLTTIQLVAELKEDGWEVYK